MLSDALRGLMKSLLMLIMRTTARHSQHPAKLETGHQVYKYRREQEHARWHHLPAELGTGPQLTCRDESKRCVCTVRTTGKELVAWCFPVLQRHRARLLLLFVDSSKKRSFMLAGLKKASVWLMTWEV